MPHFIAQTLEMRRTISKVAQNFFSTFLENSILRVCLDPSRGTFCLISSFFGPETETVGADFNPTEKNPGKCRFKKMSRLKDPETSFLDWNESFTELSGGL